MMLQVISTIATVLGVWVGLAVFLWRVHVNLNGRMDALQKDVQAMHVDLHGRLTAVETTLGLLIKGLHIEIGGKEG